MADISREQVVEEAVSRLHPYEVPCIERYEVRANKSYIDWIEASTGT